MIQVGPMESIGQLKVEEVGKSSGHRNAITEKEARKRSSKE